MGLSFLTPLFLAGLLTIAVPVLVHLVSRQDPKGISFPSLMFLRRIPFTERRRRQIRHWPLLLLRCLALVLIVLAFAGPFVSGTDRVITGFSDGRDVVVLVDRSASMAYAERWARAREAALDTLAGLGPGDRAAVMFFDKRAHLAGALGAERDALRAVLANARPTAGATDFGLALAAAARVLADSASPRREIVMISDFQRSGLDAAAKLQLAANIELTTLAINSGNAPNAAVAAVDLSQPRPGRVRIQARIVNRGEQAIAALRATLELDGREVKSHNVTLAPHAAHTVVFDLALPRDPVRATVRLSDDGLAADNTFHLVLSPTRVSPVLVIESNPARANQSLFISRALALGDDPMFRVEVKPLGKLQLTDFAERDVVIINDAPLPGGELGEQLQRFVVTGGGLLVSAAQQLRGAWPGGTDGYLPGTLGSRTDRPAGDGTLVTADAAHPALAGLDGSLAGVRVSAYRRLEPAAGDAVLTRYDDGAAALIERRVGAGRVLVLTTTLDTYWNDLPLQPVFLPLLRQTMTYLAEYEPRLPWSTVGDVVDVARYTETTSVRGGMVTVETPSEATQQLPGARALLTLAEQGFYELHSAASVGASVLAVNLDPTESDLTPLAKGVFEASIERSPAASRAAPQAPDAQPSEPEPHRLWWYLLLAALGALVFETALSNRLSRTTQPAPQDS